MKHVNHWAGRLSVILLAALILSSAVSCKKDDDKKDDPQPSASARELLVGNGNKRWYYKQEGTVKLPLSASASEVASSNATLNDYLACEQDDALIFQTNGMMSLWNGQIGCNTTDPINILEEFDQTWSLAANDTKLELKDKSGGNAYYEDIKQLTANRLHIRSVQNQSDGIYVFESVFESR